MNTSRIRYRMLGILLLIPLFFPLLPGGFEANTNALPIESLPEVQVAAARETATTNETVEHVVLGPFSPLFKEPLTENKSGNAQIWGYRDVEVTYVLQDKKEEWLKVDSYYGEVWVPSWYADPNAQAGVNIHRAVNLNLAAGAELHLFPDSKLKWKAAEWLKSTSNEPGSLNLTLLRWKDWYGIIIPPSTVDIISGYNSEFRFPNRPLLLWVNKSNIESESAVQGGILQRTNPIATQTVYDITEVILRPGTQSEQIRGILGKPNRVETSGNLNMTGEPMRLGDNWRYEREDGQLIIIFSKEGKLERFNWKLSNPDYAYKPGLIPVADSQSIKAVWRAEGTLSFNYLHEAAGDVLILYGDDGGYSGGHYDSNLYAVSRTTGKKLWQLDLGYSGASTTLDRDGKQLTVLYNKPDPKTKEFEPYIRRIRVADGKAIWEKKLHQEEQEGYTWLTGTAGVIAIYTEILERNGGKLTVWDAATGKPKWKKNMNASFHMLPAGKHDKYILIVQDHTIQALEPGTGKVAWKLSGKKRPENYNQPAFIAPDNYPIAPNEVKRWIYVGLEQLYVDLRTGKVLSRYTFGEGQNTSIEAIDDRYWLICKAQDAKNFWDAKQFATSLYDAIERKTLWEIQGLAEGGAVDNDNVYVVLDKLPAALRKSDGKIKWTIKNKQVASVLSSGSSYKRNIYDPPALFFAKGDLLLLAYGEDLLSIDKKKGKINYRIGDILLEYPDMMASYTRGGLVNEDERYLYLGSANGSFTKIEKSKLRP